MRLAALALAVPLLAHAQLAEETFDRFKRETTMRTPANSEFVKAIVQWTEKPVPQFSVSFPGTDAPSTPPPVTLLLGSTYRTWRYLSCYNVNLLADGQPVPVAVTQHTGQPQGRTVTEIIIVTLTPAAAAQIASASRVEGRLCATEFEIPQAMTSSLNSMLARFRSKP